MLFSRSLVPALCLAVGVSFSVGCHKNAKPAETPKAESAQAAAQEQGRRLEVPSAPVIGVERVFSIASSPQSPKIGKDDAKVKVLVCSDFECPFCAKLVPTVHELVENYGELIRVSWSHCPLPFHSHAMPASEAAMEVYTQAGDAAFWAYHDVLFAHQMSLEPEQLVEHARTIAGVDAEKVKAALADHRHAAAVKADLSRVIDSGAASGGFGTPATFINGRLIQGAQPYEVFEQAVERALQETPEAHAQAKAASDLAFPMARARHILVQYQGAEGAESKITRSKEQARTLAEQLATRIHKDKADFAQLAREKSDCPSSKDGGELGRFTRGDLVPQFEEALFAMQPGEYSQVVETPFGFHVIQREE